MSLEAALLSLKGLTIGDAFGQNFYGPDARPRIAGRVLPPAPWIWSDDTQLALSVVEELRLRGWIDQDYLARRMAWRFTTDPSRGYGVNTRMVLSRISQGEYFRTVSTSILDGGTYGCSVSSRGAPMGAYFADSPFKAVREASLAAAITHIHPESLAASKAVAAAAVLAAAQDHPEKEDFLREVLQYVPESEVHRAIQDSINFPAGDMENCLRYFSWDNFSMVQTAVPFALWCAAHHLHDFKEALWVAVSGLGICDTTCATVGAIVALSCGGVPADWEACREALPYSTLLAEVRQVQALPGIRRETGPFNRAGGQKTVNTAPPVSIRSDPLTGLPNLLGLLEHIDQRVEKPDGFPFCMVVIHLAPLWDVNRELGRTAGDNLIREWARALQHMEIGPVFRTGGDKLTILCAETPGMIEQAHQIALHVTRPGYRLPRTALIHFPFKEDAVGGRLMACMVEVLRDIHYEDNDGLPREFDAPSIRAMPNFSWMMFDLVEQMRRMGQIVDEADLLAQTDVIAQLPNLRAAMAHLESAVRQADELREPLAILLFDGDNLRQFNKVNIEAGDEAIRLLGATLKSQLRQNDYLARWRTGDEFLVILPCAPLERALQIGERMCAAVAEASRGWLFLTTVSGGAALYPQHAQTVQDLLHVAEDGLKKAKANGKNRIETGSASF